MLSTQVSVETPESIDLQAEPAGVIVRSLAYAIDMLIRTGVMIAAFFVLFLAGRGGQGLFLLVFFVITWFYNVIFEVRFQGQTPGKKAMGIAVVHDDLTPIGWGTSIIRNFLRTADMLPALYCFGIASMMATRHFRRLGDLAAGTLVIYRRKKNKAEKWPEVRPHPAGISLERDDQTAIVNFTQRHQQLSNARQQELADILSPILPVDKPRRIEYLRGIGCWLLGER